MSWIWDRRKTVAGFLGGLALWGNALAAVFVWDNDSGDNEWTNPQNWSPNSGLPGIADTVVFDDRKTGTVRVATDAQVRYIIFSNTTGTIEFDIPSGYRLAPAFYWQTYNLTADIRVRMYGGGTFAPTGDCYIAFQNPSAGTARYPISELTLSNVTFDCSELSNLGVSYNGWSIGGLTGRLDMSQASVVWKGQPNLLRTKALLVVGGTGLGHSLGELRLPTSLTNITVGTGLYLGGSRDGTNILHFGTNSQLKTIRVGSVFSSRSVAYLWGENGNVTTSFPKNIELVIGSSTSPAAFNAGHYYGHFTPFIATNFARFEGWLSQLWVGRTDNNGAGTTYAELDLSENATTNLSGSIAGGTLNIADVYVGGSQGSAVGVLKLPSGITNFICKSLSISPQGELGSISNSIIHFGTMTTPVSMTISNSLLLGYVEFQYVDGAGITNFLALPPGSRLRVGTPQVPASSVQLSWFAAQNRSGLFGRGLSDVTIYATNMTIGKGGWDAHYHFGTNDFRQATNFYVQVVNDLRMGEGLGCNNYLFCPPGKVFCTNLFLGRNDHVSYNYRAYLELSNTVVEVFDTARIKETGVITNYLNGYSSGLAIGTTNLFVEDPQQGAGLLDYGRMHLVFVRDPDLVSEPYWGLRLKGNATNVLYELTQTNATFPYVRLTWNTNGLSAKAASRFGIHYDATRDWSYVGVQPLVKGSLLIVR